jgi:hypothetical protein
MFGAGIIFPSTFTMVVTGACIIDRDGIFRTFTTLLYCRLRLLVFKSAQQYPGCYIEALESKLQI